MQNIIGLVSVAVIVAAVGGCSTNRMQLSKNDPPVSPPEERVKYGFPWSKSQDETKVASKELPPEIAEQLSKSKATASKSTASPETLQRAADAEARGDLDSARAAYLQVVEADPKNVEAHHRLGVIADMRQDPQTADRHYAQAYSLNRRDADLLCDMGYSLFLRNRYDESERRLKEALEVNPYHRAALSNLGLVYGKQGRYDEALAMFRQAGTESEAQRNIAQLFPNGKPGSRASSTAIAASGSTPLPTTQPASTSTAPPMPPDIDQRLMGLANDPVQPQKMMTPAPAQAQTLSQIPNLQPSLSPQSPSPQAPPPNNPFAANTAPQPAVAAKPQGSGNPWSGHLADPVTPADVAAMTAPSANPTVPAGYPTATPNAMPWPPMDDVVPAGFSPDMSAFGTPAGQPPASQPADATRWAAQMAMGAGPGSMIPLANAVPQMPAASPYASQSTPSNPTSAAFNFVNTPAAPNAPTNLNIPAAWASEHSTAPPVQAIQPTTWSHSESVAPPSPWAGSVSPAGESPNWSVPPANPPMTSATNSGQFVNQPATSPATMTPNQPPPWPGNAAPSQWPAASNAVAPPTNSAANWPVIQPGNTNRTATAAAPMMSPANTDPTTVPNWPYAAGRPN